MPKILVCAALLLLGARPSAAQWDRQVVAWTGVSDMERTVDHSSPHPLQYYLTPSAERDPVNSLCLGCPITTMDGLRRTLKDCVVDVSQRPLGKSFGRKIIEIVLSFRDTPEVKKMYAEQAAKENRVLNIDPDTPEESPSFQWKSIVMESSPPGAYREVYLIVGDGMILLPLTKASVYTVEGAQILATTDYLQGNGGICTETYWVLDAAGPWMIDFSAVYKEMKNGTPQGAGLSTCPALSKEKLEVSQWVTGDCHACGLGTAVVRFRLDGYRAIPVSSHFEPYREPPQPDH